MEHGDLVAYVRAVHARTSEVIALLDDLTLMWRPRIGEFTAGELAVHILASRAMNVRSVRGEATFYDGHEPPPGATAGLLRELDGASVAAASEGLEGADLERAVTTISGARIPAWRLMISGLIEHDVHHRSQLCEYLSARGITPPALYGLHTEELRRG
ncbi:MAG TPA: DinB family protein [Tepidiformaceae bacterium]|nr:DinB family protein [Tepidiformaceae bacterium]